VQKQLGERTVSRVAFSEITRDAVLEAMAAPRTVSQPLVDAYFARLAVDYLLGFTLSPLLWRKLPGPRSAGRVQSVALRLICELEARLEVFKPEAYYSLTATLALPSGREVRFWGWKGWATRRDEWRQGEGEKGTWHGLT